MELELVWEAVARFQERALATTGTLHGEAQEEKLVREFLAQTPVAAVFACLQDASDREDDKQIKLACACIARVLNATHDGSALFFQPEIAPFILAGLQHVEKEAQVLTLDQFVVHLGKSPRLQDVAVVSEPPILAQLCAIVADEDLEVAAKAMKVLEAIANIPGSELYKAVLDSLRTSSSASDIEDTSVEFMRYMETIVNTCAQGDDRMQYGISCRAVDVVLNCLKSQDPLFLMNVVDLLPKLSNTAVGIQHIFQSGTLRLLLMMTQDPFVGDNIMRLVGEITASAAKLRISSISLTDPALLHAFLSTVDAKLQSTDAIQQIAAVDAISAFASSSEKELELLLRNQGICELWLQFGASTKLPVKANCLHSIARILEGPTAVKLPQNEIPVENAGIWSLHEMLFTRFGAASRKQSTMTHLMELLRQPFEELRMAVFAVLRAVAAQNNEWGIRALLSYGGFFEFLLDRTTEPTKETREWKFAILDAVMASPFQSRLDAVTLDKLRASMHHGPYAGAAAAGAELEAA